ncbi:hypothetical protein RKE29_06060 [Streptomyces sp. B1866]|uniref:hypothetical protein n=1 Tax=Streptomyces sp. B1866 TaxID=3075431 RepID=UPI00288EA3FE|nr:hypothetical protein [Streptomyces sp. B1866]MDT3396204.1 hypothetical protein [Streptomyces sp. B1866]
MPHLLVEREPMGIGYADENAYDRDATGMLWDRVPFRPGEGRPEFATVHSTRQRLAMRRLLCQVCGKPADRDERGVLWLLDRDEVDERPEWPENTVTRHPPVCRPCARASLRLCPRLRGWHVAVRVRRPKLYGGYGALYEPYALFPKAIRDAELPFGDRFVPWFRASQLLRKLKGCTRVRL